VFAGIGIGRFAGDAGAPQRRQYARMPQHLRQPPGIEETLMPAAAAAGPCDRDDQRDQHELDRRKHRLGPDRVPEEQRQ
jgi:hypothetical protein